MIMNEDLGKMVLDTLIYNQNNIESLNELKENLKIQDGYPEEIRGNEDSCVKVKKAIDQLIENGGKMLLCEGTAQDKDGNDIKVKTNIEFEIDEEWGDVDITIRRTAYDLKGKELCTDEPRSNPHSAKLAFMECDPVREYNKWLIKTQNRIKIPEEIAKAIITEPRQFGNQFGYILPCPMRGSVTVTFPQGTPLHSGQQGKEVDINMFFVREDAVYKDDGDLYVILNPERDYSAVFSMDDVKRIKEELGIADDVWVTNMHASLPGKNLRIGFEAMMEKIERELKSLGENIYVVGNNEAVVDPNKNLEKPTEIAG